MTTKLGFYLPRVHYTGVGVAGIGGGNEGESVCVSVSKVVHIHGVCCV